MLADGPLSTSRESFFMAFFAFIITRRRYGRQKNEFLPLGMLRYAAVHPVCCCYTERNDGKEGVEMQRSMTIGKPYWGIIRFAIPLLIGNLFQQCYNMADAFIISRTLGVDAFAGVSCTSGLANLIIGFASGMTAGLAIPLAQAFGAEDQKKC